MGTMQTTAVGSLFPSTLLFLSLNVQKKVPHPAKYKILGRAAQNPADDGTADAHKAEMQPVYLARQRIWQSKELLLICYH